MYYSITPYIRLTRLDRPLGVLFLYILPCWWGLTLVSPYHLNIPLFFIFTLGTIIIRGAGCTFNDLIDRQVDSKVNRTKTRPLANGELSPFQGFVFFSIQCLIGLILLFFFLPPRCWPLSLIQFALFTLYPFMKRITYWPQLVLGFAINFGIIFGAVASLPYEEINWFTLLSLYGAGIFWTLGYDTIYALQDKEDDLKIGIKSTAIRFGNHIKPALVICYGFMFILLTSVGYESNASFMYFFIVTGGMLLTFTQLFYLNPANPMQCQKIFANSYLGWLIWFALLTL